MEALRAELLFSRDGSELPEAVSLSISDELPCLDP
jgi:hypothetical protein